MQCSWCGKAIRFWQSRTRALHGMADEHTDCFDKRLEMLESTMTDREIFEAVDRIHERTARR